MTNEQAALIAALRVRALLLCADWWLARAVDVEKGAPQWLREVTGTVDLPPAKQWELDAPFREQAGELLRRALICEWFARDELGRIVLGIERAYLPADFCVVGTLVQV